MLPPFPYLCPFVFSIMHFGVLSLKTKTLSFLCFFLHSLSFFLITPLPLKVQERMDQMEKKNAEEKAAHEQQLEAARQQAAQAVAAGGAAAQDAAAARQQVM